jgi:hypothetical protein
MSMRFNGRRSDPVPAVEAAIATVMTDIGVEIARWENGDQSPSQTYVRIDALVNTGK